MDSGLSSPKGSGQMYKCGSFDPTDGAVRSKDERSLILRELGEGGFDSERLGDVHVVGFGLGLVHPPSPRLRRDKRARLRSRKIHPPYSDLTQGGERSSHHYQSRDISHL